MFLTTHSDNTIKSCMTCLGEDSFMHGGVNHLIILLLFTPEKDKICCYWAFSL